MDYPNGNELFKYQWDYIHNPEGGRFLFVGSEEGAAIEWIGNKYYTDELIKSINTLLEKVSFFNSIYKSLSNSPEVFKFDIYKLGDFHVDPTTRGYFRRAEDIVDSLTFLDLFLLQTFGKIPNLINEAGSESNPHLIKFAPNENTRNRYVETTVKVLPTVFEEMFHAGQYLFHEGNAINPIETETEVKITRGFVLFLYGGYYGTLFPRWRNYDDWGKRVFDWDKEANDYLYLDIIKFYEAIVNNNVNYTNLSLFRAAIKKYAIDVVYPIYQHKPNWHQGLLDQYQGTTPYFDYLILKND
jgi:hypothetical protein